MATTAITCTVVQSKTALRPGRCCAEYSLLLPSSWTAAGVDLDLSTAANGSFDTITSYRFGPGDAVTDFGDVFDLIGTAATAGDGITASTCKVVAHRSTGSAAALVATPDTTDLSGITVLKLYVEGH